MTASNSWGDWTAVQRDLFRSLHAEGHSYNDLAKEMNRLYKTQLTRSAVCGIVHRIGLAKPFGSREKAAPARPKRRKIAIHKNSTPRERRASAGRAGTATRNIADRRERLKAEAELGIEAVTPEMRAGQNIMNLALWKVNPVNPVREFLQLESDSCRWPLTADDGRTVFCHHNKSVGAYCVSHGSIAYRSPNEQR